MADDNQATEWYLARDGQQHGPVTEQELKKIIELGYLRPTDLVWRQGMADWAMAETVLNLAPPAPPPPPAPPRPAQPEPRRAAAGDHYANGAREPAGAPAPHVRVDPDRTGPPRGEPYARPGYGAPPPSGPHGAAEPLDRQVTIPAGYAGRQGPLADPHGGPRGLDPAARGPDPYAGHGRPGPHGGMPQPDRRNGEPYSGGVPHGARGPAREALGGPAGSGPGGVAPGAAGAGAGAPPADDDLDGDERRGFPWKTAVALVLVAAVAAGGWHLYRTGKLASVPFLAAPTASDSVPVVARPGQAPRDASPTRTASVATPASDVDARTRLQRSPLWQKLKRDFPEWYNERIEEVSRLQGDSRTEREIGAAMTRAVVDLRRKHQADALAASPGRLKVIAASFVDSLAQLAKESIDACYGYISQGELSPVLVDLKSAEHRERLDAQLASIFDAVAEGRKAPEKREPPRREDYDALSVELGKRGWSAADLQLFTDPRALSRAAPEKVCQMVQDWFAAQLSVPDEASKTRLLGEALKPVVAG